MLKRMAMVWRPTLIQIVKWIHSLCQTQEAQRLPPYVVQIRENTVSSWKNLCWPRVHCILNFITKNGLATFSSYLEYFLWSNHLGYSSIFYNIARTSFAVYVEASEACNDLSFNLLPTMTAANRMWSIKVKEKLCQYIFHFMGHRVFLHRSPNWVAMTQT